MIILIFFLAIGIILGYFEIIPIKFLNTLSKIPYISLLVILFFMGSKIGLDKAIIKNIQMIGLKALIIAFGSILGSLAFIRLIIGNTNIFAEREEKQS